MIGFARIVLVIYFPNDPKTANIQKKSKELKVVHYISSRYNYFYHDKPLFIGGCDCTQRRRIDLRRLINSTMLCIEIDEEQHRGYDEEDEEARYNDLYMGFSGKFIFIRYNPDSFKDNENKKRNPRFENRMQILEEEIRKQTQRIKDEKNNDLNEIVYLFYNDF